MDTTELESVTSSMSTKRSNQLSYASKAYHCTKESIDCKPLFPKKLGEMRGDSLHSCLFLPQGQFKSEVYERIR